MKIVEEVRENGWSAGLSVARFYPRRYLAGGTLWALVAFMPLIPGLLLKAAFDRIAPGVDAHGSALAFLAILAGAELGHSAVLWSAIVSWTRWWSTVTTWMRGNLLRAVLLGPGPPSRRLPGSAGEAVGRFRDDVSDVVWLTDGWVDLAGALALAVVGVGVMVAIDPLLTLMVVLPLGGTVFVTRFLGNRIRRLHRGMRRSGAAVTSFVADLFTNAQTLKTSGSEARAIARFHQLNVTRGSAAVRAQVAHAVTYNVGVGAANISIGLVLLLAATAMRSGAFTVGDLALSRRMRAR